MIQAVGKPVLQRYPSDRIHDGAFGAWMKESCLTNCQEENLNDEAIWETRTGEDQTLFEFASKSDFGVGEVQFNYTLPITFEGNDHVIFNESFFYFNGEGEESLVQFELATGRATLLKIPLNPVERERGVEPFLTPLYDDGSIENGFLDMAVDENGLWFVFGLASTNHTVVAKLEDMQLQYMWELSLDHRHVADTFIACGVLYLVERDRIQGDSLSLS